MSEREKTYVEDVNRSIYDIRNEEKDVYRIKKGLTPDIVAEISEKKKDPAWMANFRLQSLQIYNEMEVPDWGPSIEGLNMEDIVTYVKPNTHMSAKWYLRKIGDPTGGAEVPRRCGRPVRFRAGISQCQGRSGSPGRSLYRYGECPEWGICGYGEEAFYEAGDPQRSQIRSAARCCVVRRLLRICSPRSVCDDSPAVLFSTERTGSRTVRAYTYYCR